MLLGSDFFFKYISIHTDTSNLTYETFLERTISSSSSLSSADDVGVREPE